MITYPCNLYPLAPDFYIVKLGFTGIFIILALNHRLSVLVLCGSNVYPQFNVLSQNKNTINFFHLKISFLQPSKSLHIA